MSNTLQKWGIEIQDPYCAHLWKEFMDAAGKAGLPEKSRMRIFRPLYHYAKKKRVEISFSEFARYSREKLLKVPRLGALSSDRLLSVFENYNQSQQKALFLPAPKEVKPLVAPDPVIPPAETKPPEAAPTVGDGLIAIAEGLRVLGTALNAQRNGHEAL